MSKDGSEVFYRVLVYADSEEVDAFIADSFLEIADRTRADMTKYDILDVRIVKRKKTKKEKKDEKKI